MGSLSLSLSFCAFSNIIIVCYLETTPPSLQILNLALETGTLILLLLLLLLLFILPHRLHQLLNRGCRRFNARRWHQETCGPPCGDHTGPVSFPPLAGRRRPPVQAVASVKLDARVRTHARLHALALKLDARTRVLGRSQATGLARQ